MPRIKRVFAALTILALFLLPVRAALAVEIDPYLYKSLSVGLYFQYDKETIENNGSSFVSDYTSFEQQYTFDILGNIVSRWLMTYDTGLYYSRQTSQLQNNSNKRTVNQWYYYVSTTLLPKSNIPLTLYVNHDRYTVDTTSAETWRTKTNYGINWRGVFRQLPKMNFRFESKHNKSESTHTVDSEYNFDLKKKIGPTDNTWENRYTRSQVVGFESDSTQLSTNFRNITDISRFTRLGVSAAASKTELVGFDTTTVIGMNTSLSSTPSKEFTHSHTYSFVSVTQDGETNTTNERNFYAGSMSYEISDKTHSSASVSVNTGLNNTPTSSRDAESMTASGTISYRATDHWSLSESVTYSRNDSTSEDVGNTTLDNRLEFLANTIANYSNSFSWATMSGSGSLGYSQTSSNVFPGGKGLSQGAGASLGNVSIIPVVLLNASGNYASTRVSTSDRNNKTASYSVSASNAVLNKFIELTGGYSFSEYTSTATSSDQNQRTISYGASSNYIKSLPVSFSHQETEIFDSFNGFSTNKNENFIITHDRVLLQGQLSTLFSYKSFDSSFIGGEQHSTNQLYRLSYKRGITRNSLWDLLATLENLDLDSIDSGTTQSTSKTEQLIVKNGLLYQLRSWLLTAEHTYKKRTEFKNDYIENKLMLSASRSFGFSWK